MKQILFFILLILVCYQLKSQNILNGSEKGKRGDLRIVFYNVENHFDCFDDSLKLDNEFLPQGEKAWTFEKYRGKAQRIAKVIMAAGEWELPDIIGLCEVENRFVIDGIFQFGPMNHTSYKVIHKDSPDRRGIDVALIYQPERFQVLDTDFLKVCFGRDTISTTREILYVKGTTHTLDTLHLFVNHWPSRWGGQLESEHKRISAANVLRRKVDAIIRNNSKANIIIMGDFNDFPSNKSVQEILRAKEPDEHMKDQDLYNLAFPFMGLDDIGSHKYKEKWSMLDHFIVSGNLMNKNGTLYCTNNGMSLFTQESLLMPDVGNYGRKPFRTYMGYKYLGGYSDHLPIVLDLWRK